MNATKLTSPNGGSTVRIEDMIAALESAPSKAEVLQALRYLRRDKVTHALHDTVKAAAFDCEKALEEMLIGGKRSDRTKRAYRDELRKLFSFADREGLPILALTRADCNRFRDEMLRRYSPNNVRLTLAAASALWKYLELTRVVQMNPFAALALPRREYKHRIEPDQGAPIPVMNDEEARSFRRLRRTCSGPKVRT